MVASHGGRKVSKRTGWNSVSVIFMLLVFVAVLAYGISTDNRYFLLLAASLALAILIGILRRR